MGNESIYSEAEIDAALAACQNEPVHIPGAIQAFGVLIHLDRDLTRIKQVSANIEEYLAVPVIDSLAMSPRALLGKKVMGSLQEGLAGGQCRALRARFFTSARRRPFRSLGWGRVYGTAAGNRP